MSKSPDLKELKEKLDEFKWNKTKTGEYFGVTDASIRKWIKKYKIDR
jgi:transcriptional regulator with AAA-type ATPase domain